MLEQGSNQLVDVDELVQIADAVTAFFFKLADFMPELLNEFSVIFFLASNPGFTRQPFLSQSLDDIVSRQTAHAAIFARQLFRIRLLLGIEFHCQSQKKKSSIGARVGGTAETPAETEPFAFSRVAGDTEIAILQRADRQPSFARSVVIVLQAGVQFFRFQFWGPKTMFEQIQQSFVHSVDRNFSFLGHCQILQRFSEAMMRFASDFVKKNLAGRLPEVYTGHVTNSSIIMTNYTEQKFSIPELKGISKKAIEEHLKLYAGYVKNANTILAKIGEYMADSEKNAYVLGELQRRFSFEYNGIRNHEYYFRSLEGGAKPLPAGSALKAHIEKQAPSFEIWLAGFKSIAMTRGIGWAELVWDPHAKQLTHAWVDEQHLGQLLDTRPVLMLDMWEHSFLFDYVPGDKKKYVEAFFENLNWEVIEENFKKATM